MNEIDVAIKELEVAAKKLGYQYVVAIAEAREEHDYWRIRYKGSCLRMLGLAREIEATIIKGFDRTGGVDNAK